MSSDHPPVPSGVRPRTFSTSLPVAFPVPRSSSLDRTFSSSCISSCDVLCGCLDARFSPCFRARTPSTLPVAPASTAVEEAMSAKSKVGSDERGKESARHPLLSKAHFWLLALLSRRKVEQCEKTLLLLYAGPRFDCRGGLGGVPAAIHRVRHTHTHTHTHGYFHLPTVPDAPQTVARCYWTRVMLLGSTCPLSVLVLFISSAASTLLLRGTAHGRAAHQREVAFQNCPVTTGRTWRTAVREAGSNLGPGSLPSPWKSERSSPWHSVHLWRTMSATQSAHGTSERSVRRFKLRERASWRSSSSVALRFGVHQELDVSGAALRLAWCMKRKAAFPFLIHGSSALRCAALRCAGPSKEKRCCSKRCPGRCNLTRQFHTICTLNVLLTVLYLLYSVLAQPQVSSTRSAQYEEAVSGAVQDNARPRLVIVQRGGCSLYGSQSSFLTVSLTTIIPGRACMRASHRPGGLPGRVKSPD